MERKKSGAGKVGNGCTGVEKKSEDKEREWGKMWQKNNEKWAKKKEVLPKTKEKRKTMKVGKVEKAKKKKEKLGGNEV